MPKYTKRNNDNVIEAPFVLSDDIPAALADEIMDVVRSTRFHRVSIALNSYRRNHSMAASSDDNRVITIGYIKSYNAETNTFQVVVFNNAKETVEKFKNPHIEVAYSSYKEKLNVITKFIIAPEEDKEEDTADGEEVIEVSIDSLSEETAETATVTE